MQLQRWSLGTRFEEEEEANIQYQHCSPGDRMALERLNQHGDGMLRTVKEVRTTYKGSCHQSLYDHRGHPENR
jgi:hypothetical protein